MLLAACAAPPGATPPGAAPPPVAVVPDCLRAFPAALDFGEIDAFTSATGKVRITNLSSSRITLQRAALAPPWSSPSLQQSSLLNPGESRFFDVSFQPSDGLLHFAALELTGPGSCQVKVPLRGLGAGTLSADPPSLDFGVVAPGQAKTLPLRLTNTRRVPVTVAGLVLLAAGGADGGAGAFSANLPGTVVVPALGSVSWPVTAAPSSGDFFSGTVAGSATPAGLVSVPLQVVGGEPRARLESPSVMAMVGFTPGSLPPSFSERAVALHNDAPAGDATVLRLQLPFFQVEAVDGGIAGELEVPMENWFFGGIPGGRSASLSVRVRPATLGPRHFRVTLFTNDPLQPEQVVTLEATAVTLPACTLQVSPPSLLTLTGSADAGSSGVVTFTNIGATRCVLDDVRLASSMDFVISDGGVSQIELAPGETHAVVLSGPYPSPNHGVLGFHVFNANSARQFISVQVAP